MPIMIPINVQDVPHFPVFNMDEYISQVSKYATDLWRTMTIAGSVRGVRRKQMVSDEDLANELSSRPDYASVSHDDMSTLTKEDYQHFSRSHKPMKGLEKWL